MLRYASPSRLRKALGGSGKAEVELRDRRGRVHFGWMVECFLWATVDGRTAPIRLCAWLAVVDFVRSVQYFAIDIRVRPETSKKQPGRRSLCMQRDGGVNVVA